MHSSGYLYRVYVVMVSMCDGPAAYEVFLHYCGTHRFRIAKMLVADDLNTLLRCSLFQRDCKVFKVSKECMKDDFHKIYWEMFSKHTHVPSKDMFTKYTNVMKRYFDISTIHALVRRDECFSTGWHPSVVIRKIETIME